MLTTKVDDIIRSEMSATSLKIAAQKLDKAAEQFNEAEKNITNYVNFAKIMSINLRKRSNRIATSMCMKVLRVSLSSSIL